MINNSMFDVFEKLRYETNESVRYSLNRKINIILNNNLVSIIAHPISRELKLTISIKIGNMNKNHLIIN